MPSKYVLSVSVIALFLTMGIVGLASAYQNKNAKNNLVAPIANTGKSVTCSSNCLGGASCRCNGENKCANFVDNNDDGKCDCSKCAQNSESCGCGTKTAQVNTAKTCGCGGK